ncbi:MAG TPA: SPFH domain-containing protein, partial [Verrucomicrobiae bacterium]|nr:SPFH domain-containing protein [Verrucomicrobiae bacterium]
IGVLNFVVLLIAGGLSYVLGRYTNSLAGQVGAVFFGIGFFVGLISFFQMGLEEKERLEKLEFDEISREKNAASLFSTEAETFPARRSREQFERFFLPGFTIFLFLVEAAAAYLLWRSLDMALVIAPRQPFIALALYAVLALILFLLGKYSANIARFEKQRLLRPVASFLVLGSYIFALIVLCLALIFFGVPLADYYLSRVLAVILGLAAVESLLNLVLEVYRPRVRGKQERLVYESRLLGLLAQPEGIFTTAAQALDYQFGFKVSETWFYQFLEKALAWLILVQFIVLVLSSCFVFVNPGEEALLERFGRPVGRDNLLNSGLHLKMPWPIDKVYRFRTQEIQTFNVGNPPDEEQAKTIAWAVKHEENPVNFMVAAKENLSPGDTNTITGGVPVDLLTVGIPIQYQIKDVRAFAYNHVDSSNLLQRIATREVSRYLVGVDLFEVMSSGQAKAAADLQKAIQDQADALKMGVKIVLVGLEDLHPPQKVAKAFENVVGARQESEAKILEAEGYAFKTVELARGEGGRLVHEAEAFKFERVANADGQAAQFKNQLLAYQAAPSVYKERLYLQPLMNNATNIHFIVKTATNTHDSFQIDLQEKIAPNMSDIPIPGKK